MTYLWDLWMIMFIMLLFAWLLIQFSTIRGANYQHDSINFVQCYPFILFSLGISNVTLRRELILFSVLYYIITWILNFKLKCNGNYKVYWSRKHVNLRIRSLLISFMALCNTSGSVRIFRTEVLHFFRDIIFF